MSADNKISILEDNIFLRAFGLMGYNFYSKDNQLSNDELMIRHKCSEILNDIIILMTDLEIKFTNEFLKIRRGYFPSSENNEKMRKLKELKQQIMNLSSNINGLTIGRQDRFFKALLNRKEILEKLKDSDILLMNEVYHFFIVSKEYNFDDFLENSKAYLKAINDSLNERKNLLDSFN
jgi:hypothetical protein